MKLHFSIVNAYTGHQMFYVKRICPLEEYLIIQKECEQSEYALGKIIERQKSR